MGLLFSHMLTKILFRDACLFYCILLILDKDRQIQVFRWFQMQKLINLLKLAQYEKKNLKRMPCEDLLKVIKMSQTKAQLSKQIPVLSQHRSSRRTCSVKKMLLKVLEISRKAFVLECMFNNIVDLQPLGCFVKKKFLKNFHRKTLLCL